MQKVVFIEADALYRATDRLIQHVRSLAEFSDR